MKAKVFFLPWEKRDDLSPLITAAKPCENFSKSQLIAIKMHFGERGNDGYIRPDFVRPFIKLLKQKGVRPFLADTNTIYTGPRNNAAEHMVLAAEHGFATNKLACAVIIADGLIGNDYEHVKIDGNHFKQVKIATGFTQASGILALSHFKGHLVTGFGGAIKNLGMGCGSRLGKFEMHSSARPAVSTKLCVSCGACLDMCDHLALSLGDDGILLDDKKCVGCGECVLACPTGALSISWSEGTREVQERCVEYALGAVKGKNAYYVNFLNHITPNCDCLSKNETPLLDDIGILASSDPVAIDKACYDLVVKKAGDVFAKFHSGINSEWQLEYAEKLGLGKREYELVMVG